MENRQQSLHFHSDFFKQSNSYIGIDPKFLNCLLALNNAINSELKCIYIYQDFYIFLYKIKNYYTSEGEKLLQEFAPVCPTSENFNRQYEDLKILSTFDIHRIFKSDIQHSRFLLAYDIPEAMLKSFDDPEYLKQLNRKTLNEVSEVLMHEYEHPSSFIMQDPRGKWFKRDWNPNYLDEDLYVKHISNIKLLKSANKETQYPSQDSAITIGCKVK